MNKFVLFNDDCLKALKKFPDNSIDACVTDPPYGIRFMNSKWDYDVPKKEIWEEVLRVLKPGAHLLAFLGLELIIAELFKLKMPDLKFATKFYGSMVVECQNLIISVKLLIK